MDEIKNSEDHMTPDEVKNLIEDRLHQAGLIWWTEAPSPNEEGQIVEGFKGDVIREVVQVIQEVLNKSKRLAWKEGAQAAYDSFESTGIGYKFRTVRNPYRE